jgi:hypothetical protein
MRVHTPLTAMLLGPLLFGGALHLPDAANAAATITVVNLDGANEGFNDPAAPDPASTTGGNSGATLGAQRLQAFQFAADVWGGILESSVPIRVGAQMDPLTCDATSAVLGAAGPTQVFRDFTGALEADTWYPVALANKLAGTDLSPMGDDISATFNSSIGTTCAFPRVWYYGLDANPPAGTTDFVTVVLHELGHGLGFTSFVGLTDGKKLLGSDDTYMRNLEDHSTGKRYPDMSDAERAAANIATGNLHWVGPNVVAASIFLTAGRSVPSGHVQMYAPNPVAPGSSVSHFDTALTPNELMEPFLTGVSHNVGLAEALMGDIGWGGALVDLDFIVDLSGSFADDLPVFKAEAPTIIADLKAKGLNLKVGVGSFEDYPISPFGSAGDGDQAYRRNIDLTANTAAVEAVINGLFTRFGADEPESQLAALFQAATGAGQDLSGAGFPGASIPPGQQANFRDGAVKLFLLWTDAPFHMPGDPGTIPYPGPSFADTVAALQALDPPQVIGIASGSDPATIADLKAIAQATNALAPMGGVDCNDDGTIDIPEGEPLVCTTAITGEGVGKAMLAAIEAALAPETVEIKVFPVINVASRGKIPVAILSSDTFDALQVDPKTVCFGREATPGVGDCTESPGKSHVEDVNNDGLLDLKLHYDVQETGIELGDDQACLTGQTFDGSDVEGCDAIRTRTRQRR